MTLSNMLKFEIVSDRDRFLLYDVAIFVVCLFIITGNEICTFGLWMQTTRVRHINNTHFYLYPRKIKRTNQSISNPNFKKKKNGLKKLFYN